ncbi:MAG: zinc-ribbon domain-containing protein [Deltaproteobacteria bacterium]|nr:zinc-ribbon domain-containing protein [Deltaproteobacteria bacterium]
MMIIRCRKCETDFRFDDQIMTGEGVWVRCGRCQDVFFQDNPSWEKQASLPAEPDNKAAVPDGGATTSPTEPILSIQPDSAETTSGQTSDAKLLSRVKGIQDAIDDAARPGSSVKEFDDDMFSVESEGLTRDVSARLKPTGAEEKNKMHPVLKVFAYILLVLLVIIVLTGVYIGVFPEDRQRVADALSPYFPWAENLIGQPGSVWGQAIPQDVRQHFVNNWLMGNLRVVEGTVVNKGKYPLTRVQVRGRLYDTAGSIIGEWTSFCGKILTDGELATLSENQLKRMLSEPLGSNVTGDRLNPNGNIPFMVVIAHHDQQAVGKTTVMVSGAEKLLE